jgi:hypothetical protein
MANKTRSSKRLVKLPARYNDQVKSTVSQEKVETSTGNGDKGIKTGLGKEMAGNKGEGIGVEKNVNEIGVKVVDVNSEKDVNIDADRDIVEPEKDKNDDNNVQKEVEVPDVECVTSATNVASAIGKESNEVNIVGKNSVKSTVNSDNTSRYNNAQGNTYAKMVTKGTRTVDNRLSFVPTEISNEGSEIVIFDEDLVQKGSSQWKLTVCGHFIGYKMNVHELRYNIRRMWSRWGIEDIDMNVDGMCLFKFRDEEGMNKVLELGPWLVNNKPLVVSIWDPTVGMELCNNSHFRITIHPRNFTIHFLLFTFTIHFPKFNFYFIFSCDKSLPWQDKYMTLIRSFSRKLLRKYTFRLKRHLEILRTTKLDRVNFPRIR